MLYVPGVAFVIVRVRSIEDSISGMRTFELYSAEIFNADVRLSENSIAIKNSGSFMM